MSARERGPKSELARYAFGYSDKKPGVTYWAIQIVVTLFALAILFGVVR